MSSLLRFLIAGVFSLHGAIHLLGTAVYLKLAVWERWTSQRALWSLPLVALILHGPVLVGLMRGTR
jgi:hypothetical protein